MNVEYFNLNELCRSITAERQGIENVPTAEQVMNLKALMRTVLEPLRRKYGAPITVNSGFRSKRLNKVLGGASNSQHMRGEAADITAGSKGENKKLFDLIRDSGVYDQLINEYDFSWVHVSYTRTGTNRKQILTVR